jgi:phage/plasmid-like protein (TIGR03299 family)
MTCLLKLKEELFIMAHEIENVNGKDQMAYAGALPWHGLGTKVPADLTPTQMLEAAGLNWTVEKIPAFANVGGKNVAVGQSALVRSMDNKILDVVSDDWNPVQNQEAFEFFNEFVSAGDMEMHTAGSLKGGNIVWGLAKVKESFELFKGDQIDSYLLFSNFHKYGYSTDVRFTPIRVVCNNTLTLSLNSSVERMAKISHRKVFDPSNVKDMLGIATNKLAKYKEMASFLGSKQAKGEDIVEYFCRVFPVSGSNAKKEVSKSAQLALDILHTQPGSEYAEGTWWQPFNAVTYLTDHLAGRSADTRLASAWYGYNKGVKTKALELAIEMAEAV